MIIGMSENTLLTQVLPAEGDLCGKIKKSLSTELPSSENAPKDLSKKTQTTEVPLVKEGPLDGTGEKTKITEVLSTKEDSFNVSVDTIYEEDIVPSPTIVYFDIETTGLSYGHEIVQIACYEAATEDQFNVYMLPSKGFDHMASRVTGLTKYNGALFLHERKLDTVSLVEGLTMFISWLQTLEEVMLVGHNSRNFDSTRLVLALTKTGLLDSFNDAIIGFVDSIPVIKTMIPERSNYKLQSLLKEFCPEDDLEAHEALDDAIAIHKIISELEAMTRKSSAELFREKMFTCDSVTSRLVKMNRL